ncbi:MlaC/ttg2D family ABC transporter substrate-binding protein [Hyphomonas beringensis]|uniref:MlaC/ttg2D family ABC transporter substrate-binding protein n=1 Tax=Hyphomonas beringensis TaxID=1280946 RepID=UPI001F52B375|nr:ABC transporter substrate-binding protein [Hyphomonas beringensis]
MTHLFRHLAVAGAVVMMTVPSAFADAKTEAYVQKNASEVLASLNDPSLNAEERTEKFNAYMDEFTDMTAVSNFAIGKYARRFTDDELARYRKVFREYALAVYENELDDYRGEAVVVKDSVDRSPTDSIVNTVIKRQDGKDMDVRWRVLTRDGKYQVVDVALNLDGNLIWLAIEQRAQFLALLDRTNGSADALINKIQSMTDNLDNEKRK